MQPIVFVISNFLHWPLPLSSSKETQSAAEVPMMFDPSSITDMIKPARSSYWLLQPFIAEAYDATLGAEALHGEY